MDRKSIGDKRETGPERQKITLGAHGAQVGGGSLPTPQAALLVSGTPSARPGGTISPPIETRKGR